MDDKQFEQHMNLLKKTYERVPSKFHTDEVLSKIEKENVKPKETTVSRSVASKWQKVSVWAVSLASMFLIGILCASFLSDWQKQGDEQVSEPDKSDIEKLEKAYQEEKVKRQKILGMTNEQFNELGFVQFADSVFAEAIHPDSIESYRNSSLTLEEHYGEIIKYLRLPSEMVEIALGAEKYSEEYSMEFVEELNRKTDDLIMFYNSTMEENREILNTAKLGGKLDAKYLYVHRKDLPEDLENMLNNSPKQGISIKVSPDKKNYFAKFEFTETYWKLFGVVDDTALGLFNIKHMAPFTYGGTLIYNPQESAMILGQMEQILLSVKHQNTMYSVMKAYYDDLAFQLIFGATTSVFDENRVLKHEYQNAWQLLAVNTELSPIGKVLHPVVNAMLKTNWKENETYKELDFSDLQNAFVLADAGDLDSRKIETGLSSRMISWPDGEMQGQAHSFLKSPKSDGTYNYADLTPIEAVVLFDYAQELNFSEIMYGLISKYEGMGLMEDLVASGDIPDLIPVGATSLTYNDDLTYEQNGEYHGAVEVNKDEKLIVSIPVIRNKEGVWQVSLSVTEFNYEEPLVGTINMSFTSKVEQLYNVFKSSYDFEILNNEEPFIIASVYLEAFTQNDKKTQYELLYKGNNSSTPSLEEFLSYPKDESTAWKDQFKSYEYTPNGVAGVTDEYDAVVYFDLKDKFVTDETRKGFQMRKTYEGWRVHFMPFQ
jgi:hypothetical protein